MKQNVVMDMNVLKEKENVVELNMTMENIKFVYLKHVKNLRNVMKMDVEDVVIIIIHNVSEEKENVVL